MRGGAAKVMEPKEVVVGVSGPNAGLVQLGGTQPKLLSPI